MRSSALIDSAVYQFGDFTPAADNPSGIDSDGLAGASIYDSTFRPGAQVVDGQTTYDLNNLNVMLADGNQIEITTVPGEFTNFLEVTANGTADWIENAGSITPGLAWDSVANPRFPAELFIPADLETLVNQLTGLANNLGQDGWDLVNTSITVRTSPVTEAGGNTWYHKYGGAWSLKRPL